MPTKIDNLIHEDTARYDFWLKLMLGAILSLTLTLGVVFLLVDIGVTLVMLGITLFDALLFKAILPQRFQIFEDRLRIALGGPLAISIPLSNITAARAASSRKVFAYWGLRLATSTRGVVEIVRKKGLNLIISPTNAETFLEQLNQALEVVYQVQHSGDRR